MSGGEEKRNKNIRQVFLLN